MLRTIFSGATAVFLNSLRSFNIWGFSDDCTHGKSFSKAYRAPISVTHNQRKVRLKVCDVRTKKETNLMQTGAKITKSIVVIAFSVLPTFAHASDGNRCVSIDNDVERLQCFDGQYSASVVRSMNPEEAFRQFREIAEKNVTLTGESQEFVAFGFKNCVLYALHAHTGISFVDLGIPYQLHNWKIDLKKVNNIRYAHMSFTEAEVSVDALYPIQYDLVEGEVFAQSFNLNIDWAEAAIEQAKLSQSTSFTTKASSVRAVKLVVSEEDLPEATTRLNHLARSCQIQS